MLEDRVNEKLQATAEALGELLPIVTACEGCGRPLGVVEAQRWNVCLPCTKARHRSATTGGRCRCGNKARPGAECGNPIGSGGVRWIPCRRCLGSIRQTQ